MFFMKGMSSLKACHLIKMKKRYIAPWHVHVNMVVNKEYGLMASNHV